jgi:hypothetical protein
MAERAAGYTQYMIMRIIPAPPDVGTHDTPSSKVHVTREVHTHHLMHHACVLAMTSCAQSDSAPLVPE